MANHAKEEGTNTVISSKVIIEDFDGVEGIAQGLSTNLKVSSLIRGRCSIKQQAPSSLIITDVTKSCLI